MTTTIKLSGNETIFVKKLKAYSESNTCITAYIYNLSFTMQPKKGDIYLRYNPEKKAIFAFIFSGKSDKHYDRNFGAGEEYHYGESIKFDELNDILFTDVDKNHSLMMRINEEFKKVEGFIIWED